jgi:PhnB protein
VTLDPYLSFDGNCREAFDFYRQVFGGEFRANVTFGEAPPDVEIPHGERDRIMHVSLPIGSSTLMGSDSCSAFGPPPQSGNNFSISISSSSRGETDDLFAKLSRDGEVEMPPQDMFWGAYFGSCTDKFGIRWQINYQTTP